MDLPKFSTVQQDLVIFYLSTMTPHRQIAQNLQQIDPELVNTEDLAKGQVAKEHSIVLPEGMTQQQYEEIVIKRCKEYVSNKRRKVYQKIQEGKQWYRDEVLRCNVLTPLLEMAIYIDKHPQKIDVKKAIELEKMAETMHKLIIDNDFDSDQYWDRKDRADSLRSYLHWLTKGRFS
ncbi:MAG: hypothetical protein F4Z01_06870 [Gammaproteobacteria bacterium]|nr:hypothetical protein [Gammaproteobacteria bacterium]